MRTWKDIDGKEIRIGDIVEAVSSLSRLKIGQRYKVTGPGDSFDTINIADLDGKYMGGWFATRFKVVKVSRVGKKYKHNSYVSGGVVYEVEYENSSGVLAKWTRQSSGQTDFGWIEAKTFNDYYTEIVPEKWVVLYKDSPYGNSVKVNDTFTSEADALERGKALYGVSFIQAVKVPS